MLWTPTAVGEAERHYIDSDHYAKGGADAFEAMPRKWVDAVAKYTEDTLRAYGIVPWHIRVVHAQLVRAFQPGDADNVASRY